MLLSSIWHMSNDMPVSHVSHDVFLHCLRVLTEYSGPYEPRSEGWVTTTRPTSTFLVLINHYDPYLMLFVIMSSNDKFDLLSWYLDLLKFYYKLQQVGYYRIYHERCKFKCNVIKLILHWKLITVTQACITFFGAASLSELVRNGA